MPPNRALQAAEIEEYISSGKAFVADLHGDSRLPPATPRLDKFEDVSQHAADAAAAAHMAILESATAPRPAKSPPLNTHFVGVTGIRTVYAAFVLTVAGHLADAHLGTGSSIRIILHDLNTIVVPALGLAGGGAAYVGRPKNVAPSDSEQVLEAAIVGAPHPITPAKEAPIAAARVEA
jgi:hypothetical protein